MNAHLDSTSIQRKLERIPRISRWVAYPTFSAIAVLSEELLRDESIKFLRPTDRVPYSECQ